MLLHPKEEICKFMMGRCLFVYLLVGLFVHIKSNSKFECTHFRLRNCIENAREHKSEHQRDSALNLMLVGIVFLTTQQNSEQENEEFSFQTNFTFESESN